MWSYILLEHPLGMIPLENRDLWPVFQAELGHVLHVLSDRSQLDFAARQAWGIDRAPD